MSHAASGRRNGRRKAPVVFADRTNHLSLTET